MRKEFGKVLRDSFSQKMKNFIPEFKEEKVKSQYLWPGERAFCKKINDSIFCWIVLSPSPKDYDEFTVLIGWSTLGRYPESNAIASFMNPTRERAEFSHSEFLIRLPQLWTINDFWWVVKPFIAAFITEQLQNSIAPITKQEAEALVIPQVEAAFSKLMDIGIPYLFEFIQFKNNNGNSAYTEREFQKD
jgi:hypothetical protein